MEPEPDTTTWPPEWLPLWADDPFVLACFGIIALAIVVMIAVLIWNDRGE
jgi:hypothetical protein